MISALVSISGQAPDDDLLAMLVGRAQFVVLNIRNGRSLLDVIVAEGDRQWLLDTLSAGGRNARLVGSWHRDGKRERGVAVDVTEYLAVAPDVVDGETRSRPTEYRQTHGWLGWDLHSDDEAV